MKKITYLQVFLFLVTVMLFSLSSCDDPMKVSEPVFEVSLDVATAKVGDSVVFKFKGSPDILSFYSGEKGHRFQYKDIGEQFELDSIKLSFVSQLSNASKASERKVLLSTDFSGNYKDKDSLYAATWIDVTSKFKLATSNTETNSGTLDLTQYKIDGKPLFIAFQYKHFAFSTASGAPSWRMKNLDLEGKTVEGYKKIADISPTYYSAGFNITDFAKGTDLESISIVSANVVRLQGKDGPVSAGNEIWATSGPINLNLFAMPTEVSVPIQSYADKKLSQYSYTFSQAGEYTVVFVAKNISADESLEVIKKVTIKIEE